MQPSTLQPTPSERIACNYTPAARGLSPRMLEVLSPGGIRPGAVGPLPLPRWAGVDEQDAQDGVPEVRARVRVRCVYAHAHLASVCGHMLVVEACMHACAGSACW